MKLKYCSVALLVFFMSCDNFLDEIPNKQKDLVIETTDHLDFLLNSDPESTVEYNPVKALGSDDYGTIRALQDLDAYYIIYSANDLDYALWNTDEIAKKKDTYYSREYGNIYNANLILTYVDKVNGPKEDKDRISAEAHFIRAYAMLNLVETYCLPYSEINKDELGLILKTNTGYNESLSRATLEQTYQMIERDILKALETKNMIANNSLGYSTSFRANISAANGLAARFYLLKEDYIKAYNHAKIAFDSYPYLSDYNEGMSYSAYSPYYHAPSNSQIWFPMTRDFDSGKAVAYENKELYYNKILYTGNSTSMPTIPSQELINLFDKDYDLRYKYYFVENATVYLTKDYTYKHSTYYRYPGPTSSRGQFSPSGPQSSEMLLVQAECLARQNRLPEAMDLVNTLRKKRFDKNTPTHVVLLSADNKETAVAKVLEERRRELAFVSRWSDIRRLNNNSDSFDDVGNIVKEFYKYDPQGVIRPYTVETYILESRSRKFATPISQLELDLSEGKTLQNTY